MPKNTALTELFDSNAPLRTATIGRLASLGQEEGRDFAELAAAAPAARRLSIARRMYELSEDDPTLDFSTAFKLLLSDEDADVRHTAIDGLWEYDDRSLIEPLIALLNDDPDEGVRSAAAMSLGRFVVMNEFELLRPADTEQVLGALRAAFDDFDQPSAVRARALEAVAASSSDWVPNLIWQAYDSDDARIRLGAVQAMGRTCDASWLPTLFEEMQNGEPENRFEAANAAGQIGEEEAIPQLAELFEDQDTEVQEAAIAAVGLIGGDAAVDLLAELLPNADERIVAAAQDAISEARGGSLLDGASEVPGVYGSLGDDDEDEEDDLAGIEDD